MQAIRRSEPDIVQDALNRSPIRVVRSMKKLADMVDSIGDIRTSNIQVLVATNNTAILSSLINRETY